MHKDLIKKINLSSLVKVRILQNSLGNLQVFFEPIDNTRNVVIDENALASLNEVLEKKLIGESINNPNVYGYIQELCERWIDDMGQSDLAQLVDAE